jgi:hypothetical protein
MGFIAMAIFLDKFKWGKNYITIIGSISILSSAAELAHRKELIVSLILALLLFIVLLFIRKRIPDYFKKILTLRLALIILVMFFVGLYILNKKYDSEEFLRYPLLAKGKERGQRDIALAWQWLNLNTGSGKRIAYTGRSEFYPLFGTGVKNSVVYISLNSHTGLPHNYPDGLYRKEKDFPAWIDNLKKSGIDYLFIALPHAVNNESGDPKRFPIEDEWAAMHPGTFKSVFSNSLSHIYQVSFKN